MFIKQRQVRKSRFQSRFSHASLKRREHTASLYTTGVIQLFLVCFLIIGALRSAGAMRAHFPELVWYLKYALPALMILMAAVVLRFLVVAIIRVVDAYRHPPAPPRNT